LVPTAGWDRQRVTKEEETEGLAYSGRVGQLADVANVTRHLTNLGGLITQSVGDA
jgi:hypothetical protein